MSIFPSARAHKGKIPNWKKQKFESEEKEKSFW